MWLDGPRRPSVSLLTIWQIAPKNRFLGILDTTLSARTEAWSLRSWQDPDFGPGPRVYRINLCLDLRWSRPRSTEPLSKSRGDWVKVERGKWVSSGRLPCL